MNHEWLGQDQISLQFKVVRRDDRCKVVTLWKLPI